MSRDPMPAMADPSALAPFDSKGDVQVVVETPKGSRNKFAFDHTRRILILRKVLPAGMYFPANFGFVPSTLAEDGDPIDAIVLMDDPMPAGCVLSARVIGVIKGEDEMADGRRPRNDRLLTVPAVPGAPGGLDDIRDIPEELVAHLAEFFVNYQRLLGGKLFHALGSGGAEEGLALLREAHERAGRS